MLVICYISLTIVFSWCGPCKLLGPRLEHLVAAMKGKVILAKVDVDETFEIAQKYIVNINCLSVNISISFDIT